MCVRYGITELLCSCPSISSHVPPPPQHMEEHVMRFRQLMEHPLHPTVSVRVGITYVCRI